MTNIREPTHAGTWYTSNSKLLDKQLSQWFEEARENGVNTSDNCKIIIAPHAGLTYCGKTSAHGYAALNPTNIKRIIILGPSHHVYLENCALSSFEAYDTPLGPLKLDTELMEELLENNDEKFSQMSLAVDEDEHSFEMHTPFLKKIIGKNDVKILPIMVGSITYNEEKEYGKILSKYINDPQTLFAISTDFSHWGLRFRYTYYRSSTNNHNGRKLSKNDIISDHDLKIHESISNIDHEAWDILNGCIDNPAKTHEKFNEYIKRTGNTICGKHPIGILLGALTYANYNKSDSKSPSVNWTHYSQSSKATKVTDSSVSYSSGYINL